MRNFEEDRTKLQSPIRRTEEKPKEMFKNNCNAPYKNQPVDAR
jgi:hypothetical protein